MLRIKFLVIFLVIQRETFSSEESNKINGLILNMVQTILEQQQNKLNRESSDLNNAHLHNIQNVIADVQNHIKSLKTELVLNKYDGVQTKLDVQLHTNLESLNSYNDALTNLTVFYNNISEIMKKLLVELKDAERIQNDENLLKECVNLIRNDKYSDAEEKLSLISDINKIFDITSDIYKYEVNGFDKVLKFAEHIKSIHKSFATYKALNREMNLHNDKNTKHLLQLIKSLDNEIISQTSKESIVIESEELMKSLKTRLRLAGKEDLKYKISYGSFNNISNTDYSIDKLTEEIFSYDSKLYNQMYLEFLNEMYTSRKATPAKLIEYSYKLGDIMQKFFGLSTILDIMIKNNDINNGELIGLANYLKLALQLEDFKFLSKQEQSNFIKIKDKLPISIKNLVFSSKVCLKNVGFNEYFYSPGVNKEEFNFNKERRYVFTWIPNYDRNNQNAWIVKQTPQGTFEIKNVYQDEYLIADGGRANEYNFNNNSRHVFTWIPGKSGGLQAEWEILPKGDYCYIKNVAHDELLYATIHLFDPSRRHVLSWIKNRPDAPYGNDALWLIEDCYWTT